MFLVAKSGVAVEFLPNSLAHMCSSIASVFISLSQGGQMGE